MFTPYLHVNVRLMSEIVVFIPTINLLSFLNPHGRSLDYAAPNAARFNSDAARQLSICSPPDRTLRGEQTLPRRFARRPVRHDARLCRPPGATQTFSSRANCRKRRNHAEGVSRVLLPQQSRTYAVRQRINHLREITIPISPLFSTKRFLNCVNSTKKQNINPGIF